MPFSWDNFPYTNFHELNLDWFIKKFKEIFNEWESLYTTLTQWKEDTDTDLAQWKEDTLANMDTWERELLAALDEWKVNTGDDIHEWEDIVVGELDIWKSAFLDQYELLANRVESIVSDTEDMVENLARPFSTSTAYFVGDYVIYNGMLYVFTDDHAAGAWLGSDAAQTTAMNDINDIKTTIKPIILPNPEFWEIGNINAGSGVNIDTSTNRIRFVIEHDVNNFYWAETTNGYSMLIHCYDNTDTFLGCLNNGTVTISSTPTWIDRCNLVNRPNNVAKIRIALRKDDNSEMALTDYVGCLFSIKEKNTDEIIVNEEYIAYKEKSGLSNFRTGAIDGSGNNTSVPSYYANSFRTAGFERIENAECIISEVTQDTVTNWFHYIVFYDNNFSYISRTGGSKRESIIAEVPANAIYFRISLTQITTEEIGIENITSYKLLWGGKNIENISPKNRWYVLGDSISAGYYSMTQADAQAAGLTLDYVSSVTTEGGEVTGSVWDRSLNHNYWGYANNWFMRRELINRAFPGQGFFRNASNSQNGIYVIKNNSFSDAGLITVAWGLNDWHYNQPRGNHDLIDSSIPYPTENFDTEQITTINQAIWYCLGELIRKAPNAKIVVQTPMNVWAYGGDFSSEWGLNTSKTQSGTLKNIHDDVVYWANYYGLEILEMTYNNSIVNRRNIKTTLIDGSHPSDEAHKQLGRHVGIALKYC